MRISRFQIEAPEIQVAANLPLKVAAGVGRIIIPYSIVGLPVRRIVKQVSHKE